MKNSIDDLRNHLFDVLERLKDPDTEHQMKVETAETICLVAKRLIESAEVEIKFRAITKGDFMPSEFLNLETRSIQQAPAQKRLDPTNPGRK